LDRVSAFHIAPTIESSTYLYVCGENINISIKSPQKTDGYLTVYHFADDNKLSMMFPYKETSQTFVKAGEEKQIVFQATKPIGYHNIKVIWSSVQIVDPKEIDYKDAYRVALTINAISKAIKSLDSTSWRTNDIRFKVLEGRNK
jgi:hypothetical protein